MSCEICNRSSCCTSFHSLEEQDKYEEISENMKERMKNIISNKINKIELINNEGEYYVKLDEVLEIVENY
jgi:hypothetical protein